MTTTTSNCSLNNAPESVFNLIIVHNNIGIQDIKKNEYNDAIRHLELALKYVKVMLSSDTNHDDYGNEIPIASIVLNEDGDDAFSLSTMTMTFASLLTTEACSTNSEETRIVPSFQSIRLVYPITDNVTVSAVPCNNNDENKMLDIMTTIILYNLAICYLGIMKECNDIDNDIRDDDHRYKKSLAKAFKMLELAHGMIQDILASFTVDMDTILAWYSIHQIEYRILNAMIYVVVQQQQQQQQNDDDCLTSFPFECILNQIQHVQQVLVQYKETIQFLYTLSNTTYTAECA